MQFKQTAEQIGLHLLFSNIVLLFYSGILGTEVINDRASYIGVGGWGLEVLRHPQ